MTSVVQLCALVVWAAFAAPAGESRAQELAAQAQDAYAEGHYDATAALLKEAHALDPQPKYLYAWAQAERKRGHCDEAIPLYKKFLETDPSDELADLTRRNIVECLDETGAAPEPVEEVPDPDPGGEATDPAPREGPEPPEPGPSPDPGPATDRKRPDALGLGLLVGGVAVAAGGTGLLVSGMLAANDAEDTSSHSEFQDLSERAPLHSTIGGVLLGVGGAVAIGGAVRLGLVAKRRKSEQQARVTTRWSVGPSGTRGAAVRIGGRF